MRTGKPPKICIDAVRAGGGSIALRQVVKASRQRERERERARERESSPDHYPQGNPRTFRAVNAMLLNEFLKAHRQIDAQQKQIAALTAGLQKVSAQLELSKPEPQTVLNNH